MTCVVHKFLDMGISFITVLGFAENQTIFWDFKIQNGVRITEGSNNGDSDNRGPTVYICFYIP